MSDYDRTATRFGAGVARSSTGAIDQGLRAFMLGVYNYMTIGLGVTGVVAYAAYKAAVVEVGGRIVGLTDFGSMLSTHRRCAGSLSLRRSPWCSCSRPAAIR